MKMKRLTLFDFTEKFPDDIACRKYLEKELWDNVPVCPHCGNEQKIYRYKNGKTFKCACCGKQFSVITGTIYENSNIPLQKWFLTFYLLSVSKKGISSIELSKAIGITQKSAWYLLHKIRYMFQNSEERKFLRGTVEVDETYVGGKSSFGKRGRGSETKTPVFGMLERGGELAITPVENAKRNTLEPIIRSNVRRGSKVMSDEWSAYNKLEGRYSHEVVNHGRKEYVRGEAHTNSLEGAWSHLKKVLTGTYHCPSSWHLDLYCSEFEFNYNTRDNSTETRFKKTIKQNNLRVSYKDIVPPL